jgi:flavin-binding protein dodecin
MTTPTNAMSRIPVFKSSYWKKSEELISVSSEAVKEKIIKGAEKAGLNKKTINRMKATKSAGDAGIDDAELIEVMAKGFGVETTKKLLYDITQERRFWEASRWLFPFGNAYQEVLTTWLGIMKNNPNVIARTGTIWDGAAQENDTFGPTGKGIFYKNPINGQVVFNYPGTGLLQDWMFKDAPNKDVRVNMPVYAESINIAAGLLPGFGPVIQIPAAFLFRNFPEEGLVNKILFGEFPPLDVNNKDEWTKALGLKPAWADKFIQLIFNKGENAQGAYGNTVIDVYKALLYSGQIDDSTEEKAKEGMQKAVDTAKQVFLFRAVSQFLGPAGAASPIYEITDKNFNYFMFETLADEYRKIKEANNYDDALATEIFVDTYGLNPLPLTVAKTVTIEKRPTTIDGANWMKDNMELYDNYPLVAWYLEPPPSYAEFSFDAYKKALLEGTREYRTPEQFQIAKNKLLGSVALEQYERQIGIIGNNTAPAKALRDAKKKELEQRYWGYGQPGIAGSPVQPSIDTQIDQLIKMTQDPELQSFETIQAAKKYLEIRQQIIDRLVAAGKSKTIWKTSKDYAGVRAALRSEATKLIQETPKFGPMFDTLLSRELEPEYEDNLLVQLGIGK